MPQHSFDFDAETQPTEQPAAQPAETPPEIAARDEALERVVEHAGEDWRTRAIAICKAMPVNDLTGEDIRLACEQAGIRPHHHNAWGGLVMTLVKQGVLFPSGTYRAMRANGSHGRKTQIYTKSCS